MIGTIGTILKSLKFLIFPKIRFKSRVQAFCKSKGFIYFSFKILILETIARICILTNAIASINTKHTTLANVIFALQHYLTRCLYIRDIQSLVIQIPTTTYCLYSAIEHYTCTLLTMATCILDSGIGWRSKSFRSMFRSKRLV